MTVACREAIAADRDGVVALLAAQLGEHAIRPSRAMLTTAVDALLSDPGLGRIFVAERNAELVGVAALTWAFSLEHAGRTAWLDELYVRPGDRGSGIGSALLDAACAHARACGAVAVDLEVEAGHERAAGLYQRAGFARHERQRWFRRLEPPPARRAAAEPASPPLEGGCLCGAIRYRIAVTTDDVTHCHCSLCRRSTGAPFVTWLTVPAASFAIVRGRPVERRSTPHAVRSFCGTCGTALTFREDPRPHAIDVTAGSLDEPERVAPREHIHVRSRLQWTAVGDGLPEFPEGNPSETGPMPSRSGVRTDDRD